MAVAGRGGQGWVVWLLLLAPLGAGATVLPQPWYLGAGSEPSTRSESSGALDARLAEAERLASSGDYGMADTVLSEAAAAAAGDPGALDSVDRVRAQIEFRRGNYDQAMGLHRGILLRAEQRRDLPTLAAAEMDIASLQRRRSELGPAVEGYERALALFRKLEDRAGEAMVLTHLGLIRLNQGEFSTALELLRESQRLQEAGAAGELDRTYHYLGLLYAGMREYDSSRTFLERGLMEARRLADASREAPLLGSLARITNFRGEYAEALQLAIQAEQLAERLDSPPSRAYAGLEHGRALIGLNRLDEAKDVLERGERIAETIRQRGTQADYLTLLAEIAQRQQRWTDALALWEEALPTYRQGHDQPQLLATYRAMIPVLSAQGQKERAIEIGLESLSLQEHLTGLDMNRRMAVLESQHKSEEAERQIELLKRDYEIQGLRLRQEELGRWIAFGLVVGLVAFASLLAVRYRESRRMGRQLSATNAELIDSREQLTQAHRELELKAEALERAASTDALTGVANRRAFVEQLRLHWDDAIAHRRELSIVLIDADNFKRINDSLGHAVGDAVLCAMASGIQSLLRAGTLLARWGGEEFVILMSGADEKAAAGLAERVRAAVAAIKREDLPSITVSIGVASLSRRALPRPEALFEEADAALYAAKAGGRDRVRVATPDPSSVVLH